MSSETVEGFLKSWGMILVSEIGDKTFFIAAIMAMTNSRLTVFFGAFAALSAMTVLSAAMGWAAPNLISKTLTHWAAIVLFLFFGLRLLYDALAADKVGSNDVSLSPVLKCRQRSSLMANAAQEGESEWDEVERELGSTKLSKEGDNSGRGVLQRLRSHFDPVFIEAFVLTFMAEWGDRSQIATIGLAAATDVIGVTFGGILGHGLCTGAAVLGGRHLSKHINEKTVAVLGGVLFLLFAAHSWWTGE